MFLVDVLVGVPLSGEEGMFLTDDFAVEERGEGRILLRQTLDLQVATDVGIFQIHVL